MSEYQPIALDIHQIEPRPIEDDISIVIPTLGRPILAELMERLSNLGIQGCYISSTQRGRSAGINRGLERVSTRFVAITDDDCFVEADWLEQMAAHLRKYPDGIVTGRVEAAGEDMIVVVDSQEPAVYRRPRLKFDSMSGGNMGTSMAVFERVGYFDEHPSLATSEDGEWSYRALRGGAYIVYTPEAGVRHFGWRDEKRRESQYRGYARSHGGFYGKYLRKGDGFIAMRALLHFGRASRRWVRGVLAGDQEMASYGRAYVFGLIPGILAGIRRK
jgi:GT2 family glycosyltransferase